MSLLFLASFVGKTSYSFKKVLPLYNKALSSPEFVVPILALAGTIILIILMERSERQIQIKYTDGTETSFPIKLTTAGTTPVWWAYTLLALPFFFMPVGKPFDQANNPLSTWFVNNIHKGTAVYSAASAVLVVIFYYLMTALFFNPRKMIDHLKERNADVITDGADGNRFIDRGLEGMALIGSLYLVILPLSLQAVWWLLHTRISPVNGIALIVAVCIALDLTGEMVFRWHSGKVVPIAEFHEPWKAGLFRSLLKRENVPSLVRGYYHRSLLYLFGPYIEMTVYVSTNKADIARELRIKYMDSSASAFP